MPIIPVEAGGITVTGQSVYVMPIVADPINVELFAAYGDSGNQAIVSGTTPVPGYDTIFNCAANNKAGVIDVGAGVDGDLLSRTILTNTTITVTLGMDADALEGIVVGEAIELTVGFGALEDSDNPIVYIQPSKRNWVAWSKIGEASFVQDRTNEAGDRPMDWSGWAWQVKKLDKFVIVYGEKGITVMNPVEQPASTFGFNDISQIGIASAWSICGNDNVHYFITSVGDLWKFTREGPENLGFREFLSGLTNPILVYDEKNTRVFISDGSSGFVFDDGLGGGYVSVTGITNDYMVSPELLAGVPCSIMTDIVDLGHRGIKTISFVEVGTNTNEDLFVALDFRYTKDEAWRTSSWVRTNPEGVARAGISAVEFRVRLQQTVYDPIRIDYINLRHLRSDKRFLRGPLFEQPDQGEF